MSRYKTTFATLAITVLAVLGIIAPTANASSAPAWEAGLGSYPTNLAPGETTEGERYPAYAVVAENIGAATTAGSFAVTIQLPTGVFPAVSALPAGADRAHSTAATSHVTCSASGQTVTCTDPDAVDPGEWVTMVVPVDVDGSLADPTMLSALATISGGGASATTQVTTKVSHTIAPPGFLDGREGLNASAIAMDGTPASQAGSHPYQVNINFGLPTQRPSAGFPIPDGTLHDTRFDLPAGLVADPTAAPTCTAAEFQTFSCPEATQVGIADIPLATTEIGVESSPIYNLQAPSGRAAAFGLYVTFVPVTIIGGIRSDDYRLTSMTAAAPSILVVFSGRVQLWGSPSDESHDRVRGACAPVGSPKPTCPVDRSDKPLLTMPTSCSDSMQIDGHIDLWENPGSFYSHTAELADANGNPTPVVGCDQLDFEPTLKARPTTSLADSPTGLEAVVHIPQDNDVDTLSTPHLRKAVVTLPEGMEVNPSSANGLAGCSSAQIGIDPDTDVPNGNPVACPSASRIGKVEVDTPLLDHSLPGSVFVATPHDNPFDSLLAIYVVVDDPSTGILAKLAGHVVADPNTGRLTTTFDDNPQVPFSDFRLNFFGGATAALRTPTTCGTYKTTSSLTPWSAPESGPPATPSDTWSVSQSPRGACASSDAALPNTPSFDAGSVSPLAGAHTPFVLNLRRDDATQQFSAVNLSPPPGLLAKLAGTSECSEAALASASSKSGNEEKKAPSCPASSRIGSVEVGAGAGPSPYYTKGIAYLAGPYKGAPESMAIVTPATAGPYDLGTVVVRTALHVDPVSTKITAISDPIPTILQGIPLDVRSVHVSLDRPDFTLNGTSCEPFSVDGQLTSTQNQLAPLFSPFQLGECGRLGFKPSLALRLKGKTKRGGFPALRSVYTPRSGDANLKGLALRFPRSEFIEQGHFGTVCTRVQFAAGAGHGAECPAKSIYGRVSASTPLLDAPLYGQVYLRSSDHNLPDVVFALHGKIEAEVAVRLDSVNGGLRATVENAPDVPISKVVLSMQGGEKGLIVNSRDLCAHSYHATVEFDGQNGKIDDASPKLKASCAKKHAKGRHKRRN